METQVENFSDDESSDHIYGKGNFHGCYLLVSRNPFCKGKTYIGYTVNPNRRIKQHNDGILAGGAKKTSGHGPWDMVLIIHGFQNDTAALQFEWAWQHPTKSRHIPQTAEIRKKHKESLLEHRLRIALIMLNSPPWWRLPLTFRWLKQEYAISFNPRLQPPLHMPIAYGLVDIQLTMPTSLSTNGMDDGSKETSSRIIPDKCELCHKPLKRLGSTQIPSTVSCYHPDCTMSSHITCLAEILCEEHQLIPVTGDCPVCKRNLLWGELISRLKAQQLLVQPSTPPTTLHTVTIPRVGGPISKLSKVSKATAKVPRPRGRPPKKKYLGLSPHWSKELNL